MMIEQKSFELEKKENDYFFLFPNSNVYFYFRIKAKHLYGRTFATHQRNFFECSRESEAKTVEIKLVIGRGEFNFSRTGKKVGYNTRRDGYLGGEKNGRTGSASQLSTSFVFL